MPEDQHRIRQPTPGTDVAAKPGNDHLIDQVPKKGRLRDDLGLQER
jgi:hypothetical protein